MANEGITDSLYNIIINPLNPNSISSFIIAAALTAAFTTVTRILEHSIPRWQEDRKRRIAAEKYSFPFGKILYKLCMRLNELIEKVEIEGFPKDEDSIFFKDVIYHLSLFFGWARILDKTNDMEYMEPTNRTRLNKQQKFYRHFNMTLKGIFDPEYFESSRLTNVKSSTPNLLIENIIGDSMVKESCNVSSEIHGFLKFQDLFETPELNPWFKELEKLILGMSKLQSDAKKNRIVLFLCSLIVMIDFLNNKYYRSKLISFKEWISIDALRVLYYQILMLGKSRSIISSFKKLFRSTNNTEQSDRPYYLSLLDHEVRERFYTELEVLGYSRDKIDQIFRNRIYGFSQKTHFV